MAPIKALLVQYEPQIGKVKENMVAVDSMLEQYTKDDGIDILLLSETVFSGYVFDDLDHIKPFLEAHDGPTFQWCSSQAKRLHCHVIAGFPEVRVDEGGKERYLNSALIVDREGNRTATYSKHFLYETDKRWAEEGPCFAAYELSDLGVKIGLGICMDINPYEFTAPFEAFELATFFEKEKVDIVTMCCAWCTVDENPNLTLEGSFNTVNYWMARMQPMLRKRRVLFLASNRVGKENGTQFVGSSAAVELDKLRLRTVANPTEERVLEVEWERKAN